MKNDNLKKNDSSGNTHGTLHHSPHLVTTVQKQRNMERSLYGKLSVISLEAVNRNPPQLILDKMT